MSGIAGFLTDVAPETEFRILRYDGGTTPCTEEWDGPATRAHLLRASGRASGDQVEIVVERHAILRYTPTGAWIDTYNGKRFVSLRAGKQWASATEAEAIDQLYHRKRAQVRILESRFNEAKEVQAAMEKHLGKHKPKPAGDGLPKASRIYKSNATVATDAGYQVPDTDRSAGYDGSGGSFDGGGASGDY